MVVSWMSVVHLLTLAATAAVFTFSPSDYIFTVSILQHYNQLTTPSHPTPGLQHLAACPACSLLPHVTLNSVTIGQTLICSDAILTRPTFQHSNGDLEGFDEIAECCGF